MQLIQPNNTSEKIPPLSNSNGKPCNQNLFFIPLILYMLKNSKEIPQINISISWKYKSDLLSPMHKYRSTMRYLQAIRNRNPEILRSKEKECRCFDL
jgi:hypothetical protein